MKNISTATKRKFGTVALCGALVLSMSATTAFAASTPMRSDSSSTFKDSINMSVKVKMENGVRLYSTDDGATWNENAPEGIQGVMFKGEKIMSGQFTNGRFHIDDAGMNIMAKSENGVKMYSIDGGQTWSENAPEGIPTFNEKDGNFTTNGAILQMGDGTSVIVKVENGVKVYSTDGGTTWSENAPEGIPTFNEKGGNFMTNRAIPQMGSGTSVMVKVENGVKLYSTDGGTTWSENAPSGISSLGELKYKTK
ncbi:sialidase family protein [uncultured Clostridium sp.]|uniref:sialidase family protein n=1 Tax=uncultured Clostridium sp. TaxID=59620 RepID=UPI0028EA1C63|nr:sialidase family protein [uncultured Clostridium sp.]